MDAYFRSGRILTRPVNLIVGQSGGPTAVINASLAGVIEEAHNHPQIGRILGMRRGVEGFLHGEVVDLTNLGPDALELLSRTPGSALGACRRKISNEEAEALVGRMHEDGIGIVCYIGGNDSADTTNRLVKACDGARKDIRAIAVPKTIDNDLPETDHCPGFASAARFVALAASETTLDTRSLPTNYPVKIMEVMGRDAGWLAAASGLARDHDAVGPHLIYTPELPFDRASFLDAVRAVHARLGYAVVVVAETIRDASGGSVAADVASIDAFGHPIMRGAAESLVRIIEKELGIAARSEKPGSLQRSSRSTQSPVDLAEAREAGAHAVRLAVSGRSGLMVAIERLADDPYRSRMTAVELDRVANTQRFLPREYLDDQGTFITDAFRRYAMPLLGPNPFPRFFRV